MILKEYQIKDLIKKKSFSPFILLYGPNEGLIRENVIKISNSFKDNEDTDEISISGKNIDDDPSFLDQEIRSFSMFSKRKIIHLEKVKDKHLESIKNLEIEDENILIILKEDNLNKRSKIRSFFEVFPPSVLVVVLAQYKTTFGLIEETTEVRFCLSPKSHL